jgi:hypothetical protein
MGITNSKQLEALMFQLQLDQWSFDKDLQLIHADVTLSVDDNRIIEEPLCIDVGLPALLASGLQDTEPNRWAPADEWQRMPFFICGCGDPECRGFSFAVRHLNKDKVEFTWVEERQNRPFREMESYVLDSKAYREQLLLQGNQFLHFVKDLDYRPYLADTVSLVEQLILRL